MTRSCEQPDRQKVLHPFPLLKSKGEGLEGQGIERERESIRKFAEVCGSSMEVHERAPRVRKYTLLLSRGSSYGRQIVVASRAFGNFGRAEHRAHPGIPSRPECRRANERERARSRELRNRRFAP